MASAAGKPLLSPSLLSANFGRLESDVRAVELGGADAIHLDVMDGHFVPNLTMGPAVVKAVDRVTTLPLDVHLMIQEPDRFLQSFREAGADWISVHLEVTPHLHRTVARIRELGASPGVVLNPATPLCLLQDILEHLDFVLLMSVNPGFGGQSFIPAVLSKVGDLKKMISRRALKTRIEVDGGVGPENAVDLVRAGADILVAGNSVFGKGDPTENVRDLLSRMRRAVR
jgi:ribulose-phosphate 3-epimerase